MRTLLLFTLFSLTAFGAPLEPYRHNFFTTNPAPVVEVVAGTNTSVQYSIVGTHTRRYTVSVPSITNGTFYLTTNSTFSVVDGSGDVAFGITDTAGEATVETGDDVSLSVGGTITGDGGGLTNVAALTATTATNWTGSNAMQAQINLAVTNTQSSVSFGSISLSTTHQETTWTLDDDTGDTTMEVGAPDTNIVFTAGGTIKANFSGDGGSLTNLSAAAISGVLTQGMASFSDFSLSGTNIVISPTNGNLQSWVLTNASWAALDAANTNYTETLRVNIYGSNTLTWTTANLSNTATLGPSNAISVLLFDHARDTNLWWGYRLR